MLDDADDIHPLFHGAPKSTEFRKLRKRIVAAVREAVDQYGMVDRSRPADAPRDRWLVCLSGGKDSYTLLAALTELQWRGLLPVDILACNLDQGQPGFPATVLPEFLTRMGVPHRIEYQDTYSIVMDKVPQGRTYCALCSRLRRGNLYRIAREEGCTAVVLGHHRDDILETFFMNLFHGGRLATMPPKLLNEEGDLFVYRPLAHVAEADCDRFARPWATRSSPATSAAARTGSSGCRSRRSSTAGRRTPRPAPGDVPRADERAALAPPRPRALRLRGARAEDGRGQLNL
jgi:tRNA 2-thiocytidine biosynthesis protein TtcA